MRKTLAFISACLLTLLPLSASAHDEVGETNPVANSIVEAGKFDVSITFEENIMISPDNAGEVVTVTAPDGSKVSNGCVRVAGTLLSTPIDVDAPGKYLVSWRSVSSDGHATEGEFSFTVENGSGYESNGIPAVSEKCASIAPHAKSNDNNFGLGAFGTLFTIVASAVAVVLVSSRRKTKD